jgi:hypothetical protein
MKLSAGRQAFSQYGPGTTWIAHTPYGGDFGDAWFGTGLQLSSANGILTMKAYYLPDKATVTKFGPLLRLPKLLNQCTAWLISRLVEAGRPQVLLIHLTCTCTMLGAGLLELYPGRAPGSVFVLTRDKISMLLRLPIVFLGDFCELL